MFEPVCKILFESYHTLFVTVITATNCYYNLTEMDAYDEWKDSDEESEPEEESAKLTFKPSYVLIAIDTDESMFETSGSNHSAFMNCIEACYAVANSLIMVDISSIKGPLGIILAESDAGKAKFVEFEQSVPSTIKMLEELKKQSNDDLEAKYKRKGNFDLADFFLLCKNKLTQINADVYKRTIIYITNDDNPVPNDPRKRFKTINESKKFPSVQMDLKVFTFKGNFDPEQFYSEVLSVSNSPPVESIQNTLNLADKLTTIIQTKYKKYKYKLYPFKGDTETYMEIVVNKFIQNSNIAKNKYVTRDTFKDVKKSIMLHPGTGNYECKYAKSEKPLILDEMEKEALLESNLPIGYTLLCVGEETGKYGWVIEQPSLLEKYYKEAEPIFDSFWQFCRDKSRCLICVRKYKKCGDIRLVEMVPRYINNSRMFLARVLPFGPEIYYALPPKQEIKVEHEEEEAMSSLIKALSFNFDPNNFRDPVVAKRKAYIKSQLLEEPVEEVPDGIPSDEHLDEQLAVEVQKLKNLGLFDFPLSVKRGAENKRGIRKKLKAEPK